MGIGVDGRCSLDTTKSGPEERVGADGLTGTALIETGRVRGGGGG